MNIAALKHFHRTCQGASHIAKNKVCQDWSFTGRSGRSVYAIVSDGHGSDSYFRSDKGSQFAVEISKQQIEVFCDNVDIELFRGKPYTRFGPQEPLENWQKSDSAIMQLVRSIICRWYERIRDYSDKNGITEEEQNSVKPEYIEKFNRRENLEKVYGATLMAYVQLNDFWFAFHIGDGKMISFHDSESVWKEPVPWDERCYSNITTSLCSPDIYDDIRFCYQGDGHFPVSVFLGSDGLDDSFRPLENLVTFYANLLMEALDSGNDAVNDVLVKKLPAISKQGSGDDMSVSCVYNEEELRKAMPLILSYIIRNKEKDLSILEKERNDFKLNCESKKKQYQDNVNVCIQQLVAKKEELAYRQNEKSKVEFAIEEVGKAFEKVNSNVGSSAFIRETIKKIISLLEDLLARMMAYVNGIQDEQKKYIENLRNQKTNLEAEISRLSKVSLTIENQLNKANDTLVHEEGYFRKEIERRDKNCLALSGAISELKKKLNDYKKQA